MQQWHEANGIPRLESWLEPVVEDDYDVEYSEWSAKNRIDIAKFDSGYGDGIYGLQAYPSAIIDLAIYCQGYMYGVIRHISLKLKLGQFVKILELLKD